MLVLMPMLMLMLMLGRRRRCAQWRSVELDLDPARLLEYQRALHVLAGDYSLFQIHEHQMIAAGPQLDGLTGRDFKAKGKLAHTHHAVLVRHFVHFHSARMSERAADQSISDRA